MNKVETYSGVRIVGTGSYTPANLVTNQDIIDEFGLKMKSEQILQILGARTRYAADSNEQCSDMLFQASRRALEIAGLTAADLDLIITCPVPGDAVTPQTACVLRGLLEAKNCSSFDLGMACTGWMAAVDVALAKLTKKGSKIHCVLVGAVTRLSFEKNWGNPMHRAIFGDGAAVVILERSDDHTAPWHTRLWTGGEEEEGRNSIYFKAPWSRFPASVPANWDGNFYMGPRESYFNILDKHLPPLMRELWEASGLSAKDFKVGFMHQPSYQLFLHGVEIVGLPLERVYQNFERIGNLIAAEMPFSIDECVRSGVLARGDRALIMDYGSGFTCGLMIFTY